MILIRLSKYYILNPIFLKLFVGAYAIIPTESSRRMEGVPTHKSIPLLFIPPAPNFSLNNILARKVDIEEEKYGSHSILQQSDKKIHNF